MRLRKLRTVTAVFGSLLACSLWMAAPAMAAGNGEQWQTAQYAPQQQGQGGQRGQQQGGQQQGGQQQGGQQQQQQQQIGNNSCVQSHQRCAMMCAGNGTCVNNCNIGFAMCQQQQGGGS
ncbi:hypothetical protein GTA51_07735 [Desulfovibrio aerotolerans]|uniref:Uncharacterized protein n=1 Tax=Solidesulfovibrio aerotolerans TaxID=295255 RepID=A0A7C9ILP6_9BACT|nr:hypothetical protein [Solidesulfovibrio aerotolerans]